MANLSGRLNPSNPPVTPTATPPPSSPNASAPAPQNDLVNIFTQGLSDQPYFNTPGFQTYFHTFADNPKDALQNTGLTNGWIDQTKQYADTFATQFKNLAGRDPTANEYSTFFDQVINPVRAIPWVRASPSQEQIQQGTTAALKNVFSSNIQNSVEQQAQDKANQAVAPGSAFDVWQQSYTKSLDDTEKALSDYQTRLFEKIRPQLITSLQSQGLLNTGALDQAFAGANSDLSSAARDFITQARTGAAQDIANTRYGITSAPTSSTLNYTLGKVPNLTNEGQNAVQNMWNNYMQNNAAELNYKNQVGLMGAYNSNQPSLLSQYGGMLLGGIAGGFGQSLGKKV